LGGAGVQRSVKFVRHLPDLDFAPIVVSGPKTSDSSWPPKDTSMEQEIPPDVPVLRPTVELPESEHPRRFTFIQRFLKQQSAASKAWIANAVEIGRKVAVEQGVDLVYASMSPFNSAEAAERLSHLLGVPWVADLRDPWALDDVMVFPTRWHLRAELKRMRAALASASVIIMNTPEASRALCEAFAGFAERVVTITNGYDPEDFQGPAPAGDPKVFRIVHTGHLHARLGLRHRKSRWFRRLLGGERVPVDLLTRSHFFLLRALAHWKDEEPSIQGQVELVLAGALSTEDRMVVEASGVSDMVRLDGYLSHLESIRLMRSANLLFLPMQKLPHGVRSRIVPGKTYEYLAARRPILAAVPDGDAKDFVEASGLGDVCAPDDVAGMLAVLKRRFTAFGSGASPPPANDAFLNQFGRWELSRRLAATFEGVLAAQQTRV
jgi:glycosyltransferase involved in cell wall biosynthesis